MAPRVRRETYQPETVEPTTGAESQRSVVTEPLWLCSWINRFVASSRYSCRHCEGSAFVRKVLLAYGLVSRSGRREDHHRRLSLFPEAEPEKRILACSTATEWRRANLETSKSSPRCLCNSSMVRTCRMSPDSCFLVAIESPHLVLLRMSAAAERLTSSTCSPVQLAQHAPPQARRPRAGLVQVALDHDHLCRRPRRLRACRCSRRTTP